jgi:RIO kinase 1
MRARSNNTTSWLDQLDEENLEYGPDRERKAFERQQKKLKPNQAKALLAEELFQPESGYEFSYPAGRHEKLWLSEALQKFYDDNLISDVLYIVKGGKEANVYCCQAHPSLAHPLLAAKVYRPALLRQLKNNAMYKEGRAILGDDGKRMRDQRSMRAIKMKSTYGSHLSITSWIEHEFQTMRLLFEAGADVPEPLTQFVNAILMEYIGEAGNPAPLLQDVSLSPDEAEYLFRRVMQNVEILLRHNRIHGDLSAYNVLYWEGEIELIDFPQVVDPHRNRNAYDILSRDIERICQYFARQGVEENARDLTRDLWEKYVEKRRG